MTLKILNMFLQTDQKIQTVRTFSGLFREWRDKNIGPENGEVMCDQPSQEVRQYNEAHAGEGARVFYEIVTRLTINIHNQVNQK